MLSNMYLKKAAFDAIDTLHFSQVLTNLIYEKSIIEWYHYILFQINGKLNSVGIYGKQAEITKHYLLCALEINWSIDDKFISTLPEHFEEKNIDRKCHKRMSVEDIVKSKKNISLALLIVVASYNGVDEELFRQVVHDLMSDKALELSTVPVIIKNRLVECCYAIEYPEAPFGFYHELVNRNIIECGKYSRKNDIYKQESGSELSLLFIRSGLLFEFKMLQRAVNVKIFGNCNENSDVEYDPEMSLTDRNMIVDYHNRIVTDKVQNGRLFSTAIFLCKEHASERSAEILLKQMNKFYYHKRMFSGTQARWLGTLGAFDIELRSREEPEKAIYYEADNSRAISEEIKLKFLNYGFNVSERSLYLRHKAIKKDDYAKVRYYYNLVLNQPGMIPWHLDNKDYYDLGLKYKGKDANK
ncbi:TPA: hypothetical protein ACS773_000103 [Providencia alcalifaciens]